MHDGWYGHDVMPVASVTWLLAVALPFAIGNYFLAQRMDRTPWVWAVLTLVPVVNYFFMLYVIYTVVYAVLDRLPGGRAPDA